MFVCFLKNIDQSMLFCSCVFFCSIKVLFGFTHESLIIDNLIFWLFLWQLNFSKSFLSKLFKCGEWIFLFCRKLKPKCNLFTEVIFGCVIFKFQETEWWFKDFLFFLIFIFRCFCCCCYLFKWWKKTTESYLCCFCWFINSKVTWFKIWIIILRIINFFQS